MRKKWSTDRKTATSIRLDPNVRALSVYPVKDTNKTIDDLQTVGIRLSKEEAMHLGNLLLTVGQKWEEVEITGYRSERRQDGTYRVTVTSKKTGLG